MQSEGGERKEEEAVTTKEEQQVKHLNLCKRDVDGWRYRTGESTGRYREISGGPRRRTYTNRSSCFKCWGVRWLKIWVGVEVGERWKDDMVLHIIYMSCKSYYIGESCSISHVVLHFSLWQTR
jgi:hypothetical protein